jgi:site-specific recombinase XerD
MSLPDDVPLVIDPAMDYLNRRQLEDYKQHRKEVLGWLWEVGKNPEREEGYSKSVTRNMAYRLSKIYRWVWEREDRYTTEITHEHADAYLREIAGRDWKNSNKSQYLKAFKRLFKWQTQNVGGEPWEPEITFYPSSDEYQPQDYLTLEERKRLREASLEYGDVPSYGNLTPNERSRWKAHIAQRLEKPKEDVSKADWERVNSWKIPSLVATSLDAGLRPVEVERAIVSWIDTQNRVLRIPKEESSKNRDNWIVSLRDQTARSLQLWLEERSNYPKYESTDTVWLTRRSNPYQSESLNYILSQLCEKAGIETTSRDISWYSIRHSTGTYMTHFEDLGAAKEQLRHRSERTTLKYDNAPVEERRDALDKMG